jgi:tRNA threonylcarbamoyladenosine biosynthesis protein TsaB
MGASSDQKRGAFLALDTGSPMVSVAVAADGRLLASRNTEIAHSSRYLLRLVQDVLHESGLGLADLSGVVALQGPGSFTGLRVGLATVYGFHQALGTRVAALPTLRVIAECAGEETSDVVAVVDAHRGYWFHQAFRRGEDGTLEFSAPPHRTLAADLDTTPQSTIAGFGAASLRDHLEQRLGVKLLEPPALAPIAAALASSWSTWQASDLLAPLYLREPAVTPPPSP